jgi:hypothetical protein
MEEIHKNEMIIVEKNGKTYALLPLTIFHDMPVANRDLEIRKQFGLRDIVCSKSLYEITDEKKLMLAKIKYGI